GIAVAVADHLGVGPVEVADAHGDTAVGDFGAQAVREGLHSGLGGAVGAHHGRGAEGGEGGDLEVVATGLEQVGQEGAGGDRAAVEVDVDDAAPRGEVGVGERGALGDA